MKTKSLIFLKRRHSWKTSTNFLMSMVRVLFDRMFSANDCDPGPSQISETERRKLRKKLNLWKL